MVITVLIVVKADSLHKIFREDFFHLFRISAEDTLIKRSQFLLLYFLFKPAEHRVFIDIPDFPVWNGHFHINGFFLLVFPDLFQITGKEQEIPYIVLGRIHILISNILMDRFYDRLSFYQVLNFLLYRKIRFLHKCSDDIIRTGVRPVGLWQAVFVLPAGIHIIDHAPGIINFCIAKLISVVPLADCLIIFC